jgi:hypothetical protein
MPMSKFIRQNRHEIDLIMRKEGATGRFNDEYREDWILNDYSLYLWAQANGVNV